jgi:penicillin amidase
VKGASLPGVPSIIIGYNDSIAWSPTNARRDVVDWYRIEFQDETQQAYRLDGQWKPAEKVVEPIVQRGAETFYDTITFTHWGPVVYDASCRAEAGEEGYALRWMAHDPSEELLTFYKLNRARNYHEYRDALQHFSCPAQNFAFASAANDIAIWVQGKFPVKWPGQGKFLMEGTRSENGWTAFIPSEHNVHSYQPERGFISSANQHPVDSSYPYYVYAEAYEYYRNRRINRVLSEMSAITPQDMMQLQNDNYNLLAEESLNLLLNQLDKTALRDAAFEAYEILQNWKYHNEAELLAPAYFEAWCDRLFPLIWDEMRGEKPALRTPNKTNTIRLMREQPDLAFFDIQDTPEKETMTEVVRKAFQQAVDDLKQWKETHDEPLNWGNYKSTSVVHLARLAPFSEYGVFNGGNHGIVNATSERHGPSWRMVVALSPEGPQAWAIYPGGQSGNPGSPFYSDMIEDWAEGQYYDMSLRNEEDFPAPLARQSFLVR